MTVDAPHDENGRRRRVHSRRSLACLLNGGATYYVTALIVLAGVAFGCTFMELHREHGEAGRTDLVSAMCAWDGVWYLRIAEQGYFYRHDEMSSVAFFPAYPLAGRIVAKALGIRTEAALLVVSHGFLLAAFILFRAYLDHHPLAFQNDGAGFAVLAMGLYPSTLFFRMAYSESMFLFMLIATMYGIRRQWPSIVLAIVIGLATATRSAGVALLIPFAACLWHRATRPSHFVGSCILLIPLSCWGIAAFMAYQWIVFGDPLAFMKTQTHWDRFPASTGALEKLADLFSLRGARAVYDSATLCYWGRNAPHDAPYFNWAFLNPVLFFATASITLVGAYKRWLSKDETWLALCLLAIPLASLGPGRCMASVGRYASVAFPFYIVLGRLWSALQPSAAAALCAVSGLWLALLSALYASWYYVY